MPDILGLVNQYGLVWLAMIACILIGYIAGHSFGWTDGYGQAVQDHIAADHFRKVIERQTEEDN